ncbi:MAG: T9SS type A sorting domain-containing protein [Bacteroidales bacterium]
MKSTYSYIRFVFSLAAIGVLCLWSSALTAQYHPAANVPGTSAIHRDSSVFIDWATTIEDFHRGWQNIAIPASGKVSHGDSSNALYKANENVVSLGDSGYITLSFTQPVANGDGWDFAVFENSFGHYFLELAFVEVSSDGDHFVRFPASSLTDTSTQKGAYDTLSPKKVNNLAGKYIGTHGTPFDLEELSDSANINLNNIQYIRILDVTGTLIDSLASYDINGRKINDPWPTAFESGGFDLDAVGVIHNSTNVGIQNKPADRTSIYPNPADDKLQIKSSAPILDYRLIDMKNQTHRQAKNINSCRVKLQTQNLATGIYLLIYRTTTGINTQKILISH